MRRPSIRKVRGRIEGLAPRGHTSRAALGLGRVRDPAHTGAH